MNSSDYDQKLKSEYRYFCYFRSMQVVLKARDILRNFEPWIEIVLYPDIFLSSNFTASFVIWTNDIANVIKF